MSGSTIVLISHTTFELLGYIVITFKEYNVTIICEYISCTVLCMILFVCTYNILLDINNKE